MAGTVTAIEMKSWAPGSVHADTRTSTTVADVEALADQLIDVYRGRDDLLPGIQLNRPQAEDSLAIAVGATSWALIYTDPEYDQQCTRPAVVVDGDSIDVQWDEATSVPRGWFVPRADAVRAVSQWLIDGTLASDL
jgi:hypothetical protein